MSFPRLLGHPVKVFLWLHPMQASKAEVYRDD